MLTDKQRKERSQGIGGSDAAVLLGISPWKTVNMLYWEKKFPDILAQETPSPRMKIGQKIEQFILELYEEETGEKVEKPDTLVHPTLPYLRGNVDGWIPSKRKIVEIKNVGTSQSSNWNQKSQKIPAQYIAQVQHYLLLSAFESADIACLHGGVDLRLYTVPKDTLYQNTLKELAQDFWENYVVKNREPAPNYAHPLTLEFLKKHYTEVDTESPTYVDLRSYDLLKEQYLVSTQLEKKYAAQKRTCQAQILDLLKNDTRGEFADGSYFERKRMDIQGFTVEPRTQIQLTFKKGKKNV